jgi:hypothetical protein
MPGGFEDTEFRGSNQLWMFEPAGAVTGVAAAERMSTMGET